MLANCPIRGAAGESGWATFCKLRGRLWPRFAWNLVCVYASQVCPLKLQYVLQGPWESVGRRRRSPKPGNGECAGPGVPGQGGGTV